MPLSEKDRQIALQFFKAGWIACLEDMTKKIPTPGAQRREIQRSEIVFDKLIETYEKGKRNAQD